MKKLMITAAAVAMTAGAFADPLVYDYKASAKHMYAKQVNVGGQRIYKKFVKSASLKGYLIVDADGATSAALIADRGDGNGLAPTGLDMGRNRCFLVVQNSKAEADVRAPKLIPGVIDAKWLDTKFRNDRGLRNPATSDLAEGYLYLGGDFAAATRPALDNLAAGITERGVLANGRMIGDYAWQSIWLFGKFNMPYVAVAVSALWDNAQAALDGAMALNTGKAVADGKMFFHDAWMNGAGFGKYVILDNRVSDCCGFAAGDTPVLLQSLAGNLKGGLFLCTDNGIVDTAVYSTYLGGLWEEQFFCARLAPGVTFADFEQTDLWQDGELELNTSDCISGSWQIKLNQNASFNAALYVPLTNPEITNLNPAAANFVEDSTGLDALCGTIKGAARRLNSGANARFTDGTEIHAKTAAYIGRHNVVPMLTPSFALYYGLANWQ